MCRGHLLLSFAQAPLERPLWPARPHLMHQMMRRLQARTSNECRLDTAILLGSSPAAHHAMGSSRQRPQWRQINLNLSLISLISNIIILFDMLYAGNL